MSFPVSPFEPTVVDAIAEVQTVSEKKSQLVLLNGYDQHGLFHPSKILWRKPIQGSTLAENVNSNKRRRVKRTLQKAQEMHIVVEWKENIAQEDYQEFFSYYAEKMRSKETGKLILSKEWYQDRIVDKQLAFSVVRCTQDGNYIGGAIVQHKPDCLDICYVSYKKFALSELDLGLGACIIDTTIQQAQGLGYTTIGYGRDTNIYGYFHSLDLLRYKRWYGFVPKIPQNSNLYQMQTLFLAKKEDHPVMLFTLENESSTTLALTIMSNDEIEYKAYQPDGIHTIVVPFTEVAQQHSQYIFSQS